MIYLRFLDNPVEGLIENQNMVKSPPRRVFRKANRSCGVCLGITIDEECGLFSGGEAGGQIHRSCGLAYSTLLICDRNDSSQIFPRQRKSSKRSGRMQAVSRGTSFDHVTPDWVRNVPRETLAGVVPRGTPPCQGSAIPGGMSWVSRRDWITVPLAQECFTWNTRHRDASPLCRTAKPEALF